MARTSSDGTPLPSRFRYPRSLRSPLAVVGCVIVVIWLLIAVFAPLLSPADPILNTPNRLAPPSGDHLLGTDTLGRDVLSRVLYGSRVSIPLSLLLVVMSSHARSGWLLWKNAMVKKHFKI